MTTPPAPMVALICTGTISQLQWKLIVTFIAVRPCWIIAAYDGCEVFDPADFDKPAEPVI